MSPIVLLGLETPIAEPLKNILSRQRHKVLLTDDLRAVLQRKGPQIVFTSGDRPDFRSTVQRLAAGLPEAAVIVVNRCPENMKWLEALDAGAADYCGAPFEPSQIQWLMESAMRALESRMAA